MGLDAPSFAAIAGSGDFCFADWNQESLALGFPVPEITPQGYLNTRSPVAATSQTAAPNT
jgi:hypothetical protein